ncbi:FAD-binding oxidoreductase [Ramlibacter sp. XY19]|uniref:FAD-binding oxidoreductase n=1 Tax=Ramlibacter paludis TaxID=2908000 RepID=UPI0023DB687D|nr:FAD-binding oxidoreductase [Ramlibacter paludis]MCG2594885.1 FAD-binding oxidoreductase [Ramlibacter paludis]
MPIELTRLNGQAAPLEDAALQAFRGAFKGAVLTAADPAYEEVRKLWNAMVDRRPGLIARCTGTADVVQAVRFARQHQLLLTVRGGGHNIAGLAVADGALMVDMSLLRGVWVDPAAGTARAQAGCTLADVDRETQLHGLAAVLGFVSATGIAGLTVGGGFGYLSRRFGWTCDTLQSMEVVTAEGQVVRASAQENADLFWALRGGSGNFGIVTSFEYRLFPVGPEILGGAVAWRGADTAQVLEAWREFSASAPRELTTVAVLRIAPPAPWLPKEIHGQPIVAIFACYSGKPEEGEALLAPLRKLGQPVADIITRRPYTQMQSLLDATQPKGRRYYWKSHYLPAVTRQAAELAATHAAQLPSPFSAILLFQIGGALNELPAGHSPVGNRDAAYVLNIAASWEHAQDDAANVAWARTAFRAMQPCSTGGTYINFLTEEEGADRIAAAYGRANLSKLTELKQKWDPDNLLRHNKPVA